MKIIQKYSIKNQSSEFLVKELLKKIISNKKSIWINYSHSHSYNKNSISYDWSSLSFFQELLITECCYRKMIEIGFTSDDDFQNILFFEVFSWLKR